MAVGKQDFTASHAGTGCGSGGGRNRPAAPRPVRSRLRRGPSMIRSAWASSVAGGATGNWPSAKAARGAAAHARIVAVADLNLKRAEQWAKNYRCQAYQDYRALLDRKDVDVVIYATPEHWHYLPCIHACQAGKDIYGEQPLSHTIREGRVMIQAVRKYHRVFQTGEMQRSHPATRKAVELIRNGRIGKLQSIIGYNYPSALRVRFPRAADPRVARLGPLVRAE